MGTIGVSYDEDLDRIVVVFVEIGILGQEVNDRSTGSMFIARHKPCVR